MKITRPLFVTLASLVATGALAGGAWAAIGTHVPVNDGMQAGVEGTGAWIDEFEWIDEYEMVPAEEVPVNDGMQPGVEGTGEWIDVYED